MTVAWHIVGRRLDGDHFMARMDELPQNEARDIHVAGARFIDPWSAAASQVVPR
ncbi:hypothetical protein ACFQS7_07665 [Dankookia sp. GCM10030260]|uniref:hypothetical protein n=1 Tax=Dankookia sp. GCM10030260 TaxID=3273390 RepID=UPI00360902BE